MARTTTTGSIRTTVGTATLAIAATLAFAACGSSSDAGLTPSATTSAAPSSSQAAEDAPKAKVRTVQKASVQKPAARSTTSARSPETASTKSAALKYVKIVEPFGTPGRCDPAGTTIEMTACVLKQVVDVDYTVDVLQAQRFQYGTSADEARADLRDDANWLAKRTKTCSARPSGGSIDQITQAQCLLKVSKARVSSLS